MQGVGPNALRARHGLAEASVFESPRPPAVEGLAKSRFAVRTGTDPAVVAEALGYRDDTEGRPAEVP
jgi:hypothetical protein